MLVTKQHALTYCNALLRVHCRAIGTATRCLWSLAWQPHRNAQKLKTFDLTALPQTRCSRRPEHSSWVSEVGLAREMLREIKAQLEARSEGRLQQLRHRRGRPGPCLQWESAAGSQPEGRALVRPRPEM